MLLTGIRKSYIPTRRDGQHVSILFFTENKKTLFKIYNTAIRLQNVSLCLCCFTNTVKKKSTSDLLIDRNSYLYYSTICNLLCFLKCRFTEMLCYIFIFYIIHILYHTFYILKKSSHQVIIFWLKCF